MTPDKYSEHNVTNTLAQYLATCLLAANYFVYWHEADALQTPAGWFYGYSTTQAGLLVPGTFKTAFDAAKGMVSLTGRLTANPRYVVRLPSDGQVDGQDTVALPAFSLSVSPAVPVGNLEMGTKKKWRVRSLDVCGVGRTAAEQGRFADLLAIWFEADTVIDVIDHEAQSVTPVGELQVLQPMTGYYTDVTEPDVSRFEVELSAQLQYAA